jgi:cysteine desulfurase family protein (TIGR01976 family)
VPSIAEIREKFPALTSAFAYMENAGGSQVPAAVADAVREYMLTNYVQLGAGYEQSNIATETVENAHRFMREFVSAPSDGRLVLGPSTTALIQLVANACSRAWREGDEVVIAATNHEANIGGWLRLQERGIVVKWWPVDQETFRSEPTALEELITARTRLVALPHISNLVGQIEDVAEVVRISHAAGALVCADGVAFAPHRAVDVQQLGVDWYVFSAYKVYGPHMAVLYGQSSAFDELEGPNHSFIPNHDAYKWELGGVSHESCAGLLALESYFGFLAEEEYGGRVTIEKAFAAIEKLERPPESRLREWLASRSDLTIVGPVESSEQTVPTVSFVHSRLPSDHIAQYVNRSDMGIRSGHMYAVRLLEGLGIAPEPGVVRVSLVHYNTIVEVEKLIDKLEACFKES